MGRYVCVNGEFVGECSAAVPVTDAGLLHGHGLFETLPVYDGVPFRLGDHVARMLAAAGRLRFESVPPADVIDSCARRLVEMNDMAAATMRITLTKGSGAAPNLVVMVQPPRTYEPELYESGMTMAVSRHHHNTLSPLAGMKTLNHLPNVLILEEAREAGCNEALVLNTDQLVAEGATSNVFFLLDGAVLTPSLDLGILPGVTRAIVLDICRELGIRVRQEAFTISDVLTATEVFLTNSLMGVMPVAAIASKGFGRGCPGETTVKLMQAYRDLVRSECGTT